MKLEYPYTLEPQETGGFLVQLVDVEETFTEGATLEECLTALGDIAGEGRARYNFAHALFKLGRYDDARREVLRAVDCNQHGG